MKLKYILPVAALISTISATAVSASDIKVTINDVPVVFSDVQPVIVNSRTYVPLRGVFENLGYTVTWDEATRVATLTKNKVEITASTGDLRINNNGDKRAIGNNNLPLIIEDRFMLPVRAVSEATNNTVNWNSDTKTVAIYTESDEKSTYSNPEGNATSSEEEYIHACYDTCNEIRNMAQKTNDAAMLRFFNRGFMYDKVISPSTANTAKLKELADKLYNLEPAAGMSNVHRYIQDYSDILCSYISIVNEFADGTIAADAATAKIDELRDSKDELAMNFSVELYDYFTDKNVFYEAVYDEYVLDMLK